MKEGLSGFEFGKHNILLRCNSCGRERNVLVEFIPDLSDECRVGGAKVRFNPNPDDVRCPECNGLMNPTIYLPDVIGE